MVVVLFPRYILSIEKAEEIEEYVGDLLQGTDGKKGQFINEFLSRWKKTQRQAADTETAGLFILKESVPSAGKQQKSFHSDRVHKRGSSQKCPSWSDATELNGISCTNRNIWWTLKVFS